MAAVMNRPLSFLRSIAERLQYFRFIDGAGGGHANEADELEVALGYSSREDLASLLNALGQDGKQLSFDMHNLQGGNSLFLGWIEVYGEKVAVTIEASRITLSFGTNFEVTDADIEKAARLESQLVAHNERIIDPPRDSPRCLCPLRYPEIFKN